MNNYCRNCGKKIEANLNKCDYCEAEIIEKRVIPQEKEIEIKKYKSKEKKYIISIIILFITPIILEKIEIEYGFYLSDYIILLFYMSYSVLRLAFLITLVYARITMSNSKIIKVIFNVLITLALLFVLLILLILSACMNPGW